MATNYFPDNPADGGVAANAEPAHHAQGVAPGEAGGSDTTIKQLLAALYAASTTAAGSLPLGALVGCTDSRMSIVRRYLTALEEAGLIIVRGSADGAGRALLTAAGHEACARSLADGGRAGGDA